MPKAKLTITVDEDLLARAKDAGLRPAAIMTEALQVALGGHGTRSAADRIASLERLVRSHGRKIGKLERAIYPGR